MSRELPVREIRKLLDSALEDEPVTTVRYEDVLRAGKRALRRRRIAAAAGVVTAVAVVALGTGALAANFAQPDFKVEPARSASPTTTSRTASPLPASPLLSTTKAPPPTPASMTAPQDAKQAEQTITRLNEAVGLVRYLSPGLTGLPQQGDDALKFRAGDGGYRLHSVLLDAKGFSTSLYILVRPAAPSEPVPVCDLRSGQRPELWSCQQYPDQKTRVERTVAQQGGAVTIELQAMQPDGSRLTMTVGTGSRDDVKPGTAGREPLLSGADLLKLKAQPGLRYN